MDLSQANIKPTATALPEIFYARAQCTPSSENSAMTVINVTLPVSQQGLRFELNTEDHAHLFRHIGETGQAIATFKRMPGNPKLFLSALEPFAS